MSAAYRAYRLLSAGLFLPAAAPLFLYWRLTGKHKETLSGRLGRYGRRDPGRRGGRPRIWLHAVSVGEVKAATSVARVVKQRLPDCSLILSTTTDTGQAQARRAAGAGTRCVYAPLDVPFAVSAGLRRLRPDLLAVCETELWPNWLMEAGRLGVSTALINGRISPRSFRRYRKIRPLTAPVLASLQVLSMISEADARRIHQMGADGRRIRINGNAKYDGLASQASPETAARMAEVLCLNKGQPVLVAGSIRTAESAAVIDAFCRIRAQLPGAVFIAAPRHPEAASGFAARARAKGLAVQRRSTLQGKRTSSVVVLDTIGELMAAYGTATVVFCGGSLSPLGGQNILEPAAWGKPVLYGPSTEDFADARESLEAEGGGEMVADADRLVERALFFMTRPEAAAAVGRKALAAAAAQSGAALRHAEEILKLLEG